MSVIRNPNSRRDAPHERAELIDRIAALTGGREFPVKIDGRAYRITLEAYLAHLSNGALVELEHAASAAALCVTRLVAREDGLRLAGPLGDVDEVATKVFDVAADLVRLHALGLDLPVGLDDLAQLARAAGLGERRGQREAEPDREAGQKPPVADGEVAGDDGAAGQHVVSVRVGAGESEAARYLLEAHARGSIVHLRSIGLLRPILERIGAAT